MGSRVCGIMSSQNVDQDSDTFIIEKMAIEALKGAIVNSEHAKEWRATIGRIIEARKILKMEDCKTDQESRLFLKNNKIPFLYGIVELYDDAQHTEATELAKIIEFHKSERSPLPCFFSVEVEPVSVSSQRVYNLSVARRVALVRSPANKACIVEPYEAGSPAFSKSEKESVVSKSKEEVDEQLSRIIDNLAEKVETFQKSLEAGYAMGHA